MQHMRATVRILGIASTAIGVMFLGQTAILVNQRFQLVRTSWGIFDIQVGSVPVSNTVVEIVFGALGMAFLFLGTFMSRWPIPDPR